MPGMCFTACLKMRRVVSLRCLFEATPKGYNKNSVPTLGPDHSLHSWEARQHGLPIAPLPTSEIQYELL